MNRLAETLLTPSRLARLLPTRYTTVETVLERVTAGKTSMQAVNGLILADGNGFFLEMLYPGLSEDEAKKMTAAYASLHALEVLYETSLMENPEGNPDEFLGAYLSHPVFKQLWDIEAYHIAFGERFRAAVDRHFANTEKAQ